MLTLRSFIVAMVIAVALIGCGSTSANTSALTICDGTQVDRFNGRTGPFLVAVQEGVDCEEAGVVFRDFILPESSYPGWSVLADTQPSAVEIGGAAYRRYGRAENSAGYAYLVKAN